MIDRAPPFRSLEFFTRDDAAVFAGREDEIEEVATRILAGDTLVVYGPSGVGKTSLLCAGVIPALQERRGYRVTYVRPLRSPRGDVWRAVHAEPEEPLAAAIARLPALSEDDAGAAHDGAPQPGVRPAPHVLVLDQLEELFTRFDEAQRKPLWDGLVDAIADPRAPVRLVLALREDYLHSLDSAHPRMSNLLDRRFRLRGLTPFGARTAIVRPLVAGKIRYAPELIDRCVADLTEVPPGHSEEDGVVDPLLLQIVCSEVYRRAEQRDPASPSLTLADYLGLGGPAGVFRRHLDQLFDRIQATDHLVLKLVLQEMTTAHATKRPATVSQLSRSGLRATDGEIRGLLDQLASASLVRRYDAEPEPWYELIHDRLVQALPEQFARDQQFLRVRFMREVVRQLSKGLSEGVSQATLLSRDQLVNLVEPFRQYIQFNEQELSLLFRSAVAAEYAVTAWRAAYEAVEPGGALAIVLDMLARSEMRRSAARAVGVLGITEPGVRETCMDLALHDEDPAVEAAAVTALDAVAGAEQVAAMKRALQDKALRPRALRVLGELRGSAAFRAGIARRELRRATRLHERTRLALAKETIRNRGDDGLKEGLRTGAPAGVVAALFWCILMMWKGKDSVALYLAGAGVIGGVCAAMSSLAGRVVARAMAKLCVLDRRPTWLRAVRQPGPLITFVIALFVVAAGPSAISKVDYGLLAAILIVVLCLPLFVAMVFAVGLAEWVLAGASWHTVHTRARVAACALSLPWLLVIATGYLQVLNNYDAFRVLGKWNFFGVFNDNLLIAAFCAAWCSIWATATAGALAESMRHLPRAQRALARTRRLAGFVPAVVLVAVVAILLRETPLPFWAPVLDVTDLAEAHPKLVPPRDASRSWLDGRWVRIRNRSLDVRIVSVVSVDGEAGEEPLMVWPGTYAMWFPKPDDEIESRQLFRRIDLIREEASPGTYAVVQLDRHVENGAEIWSKSRVLGAQADQIVPRQLACRLLFADGTTSCFHTRDRETSCGLDRQDSSAGDTELAAPAPSSGSRTAPQDGAKSVDLTCPPEWASSDSEKKDPRPPRLIERAEAVVIFH